MKTSHHDPTTPLHDGHPPRLYAVAWQDRVKPKYHGIVGPKGAITQEGCVLPDNHPAFWRDAGEAAAYEATIQVRQRTRILTWVLQDPEETP
jgi:hypothetical protein